MRALYAVACAAAGVCLSPLQLQVAAALLSFLVARLYARKEVKKTVDAAIFSSNSGVAKQTAGRLLLGKLVRGTAAGCLT